MRIIKLTLLSVIITAFLISGCSFKSSPTGIVTPAVIGPSNPTPADGAINVARYVTLSWDCDGSPVDYTVYYSNSPGGAFLLASSAPITNKFITLPILPYNTKYYWKVVANYGSGITIPSSTWSFTTLASTAYPSFNGFVLRLHDISTSPPYWVSSVFQVLNAVNSFTNRWMTVEKPLY